MSRALTPEDVRCIDEYLAINQRIPNWSDMVFAIFGEAYLAYQELEPETKKTMLQEASDHVKLPTYVT